MSSLTPLPGAPWKVCRLPVGYGIPRLFLISYLYPSKTDCFIKSNVYLIFDKNAPDWVNKKKNPITGSTIRFKGYIIVHSAIFSLDGIKRKLNPRKHFISYFIKLISIRKLSFKNKTSKTQISHNKYPFFYRKIHKILIKSNQQVSTGFM